MELLPYIHHSGAPCYNYHLHLFDFALISIYIDDGEQKGRSTQSLVTRGNDEWQAIEHRVNKENNCRIIIK